MSVSHKASFTSICPATPTLTHIARTYSSTQQRPKIGRYLITNAVGKFVRWDIIYIFPSVSTGLIKDKKKVWWSRRSPEEKALKTQETAFHWMGPLTHLAPCHLDNLASSSPKSQTKLLTQTSLEMSGIEPGNICTKSTEILSFPQILGNVRQYLQQWIHFLLAVLTSSPRTTDHLFLLYRFSHTFLLLGHLKPEREKS